MLRRAVRPVSKYEVALPTQERIQTNLKSFYPTESASSAIVLWRADTEAARS